MKRIHGAYADDEEIAAMLAPFRGEVKPFSPTFIPKLSGQPETEGTDEYRTAGILASGVEFLERFAAA